MTYKEIKDRLTKCEFTLQSIKNGTFKSPKGEKLVQSQKKLELLKESLTKQLKEAEKTAFINDKPVEYEKEKDLKKFKDNLDVDSITTIDGKEIKEDVKFSLDETKAIAKKVGQAVAKALKASGDDIAHMKAVAIVENSFGINVEYKNGKSDVMSFYVAEGKLIFPTDKESITLVDIGVQPSGEPIIQVDVLANELIKHFKTMHESSFYESDSDKIDAVLKTASDQMNLTEDEIKNEVYKSLTDKDHGRSPVVQSILKQLFKFTEPKIIIAHLEGKQSDALAAEQTEVNEAYQTTYIKVAIADYKKAMAILDNNIDPTYAKMDVVDDDGDGNVIIYFNFRAKDDGEPGEDVAAFIYDAAMDLSSQGIKVVDASHDDIDEVTEQEDQEKDDIDIGHTDDEPNMLSASARETAEYAAKILKKLQTYDKHDGEVDFPNWWQSKLILARDYMSSAFHYLDSEEKQPALDQLALEGVKEVNEDQDKMMQAQWEDLSQVVKNIAHVGEMDIKDAAMESVFYIGDEFGVDGMIREYKEVEYYPETFIDIATSYMKKYHGGKRLGKMSNKQLEILGQKIVDKKYDGDSRKAYDELVKIDFRPKLANENINPEVHRIVNGLVKKMADRYDYSLQDAVYAIIRVLKSQNYSGFANEALNTFDGIDKVFKKAETGRPKYKKGQKVKYQIDKGSDKALSTSTGTISKIQKKGNSYLYTIQDGGPVPVYEPEIVEDNNPVPDVPADDMQFMHGQVVDKMKTLAKIYKEKGPEATVMLGPNNDREEKVVDVLKLLTRKKRELEDALDKKVSGIGTGQELDPNIEEETKN